MWQFMLSFEGTQPPAHILDGVRRGEISSFCLFQANNVENPAQVRALTAALHRAAADGDQLPPLIGIDQEGGQLMAIGEGCTQLPGNMALGATRSPALAKAAGRVLATELRAMGINLNFAPSLDVNLNPTNPVIGIRSFGDDPALVAELGVAMIHGIQSAGVIATAKHFPGHGDTGQDTHHTDAILPHNRARLDRVELAPFRAAVKANVGAVMSAHIRVDAIDAGRPATLSPTVMQVLRSSMGYDGLTITDAMDMHAVAKVGKTASLQAALDAGLDLILLGHLTEQTALLEQFADQEHPAAIRRIQAARQQLPQEQPPLSTINSREHQQIAQEIANCSITTVRQNDALPLPTNGQIAVLVPIPQNLTPADTSASVTIDLAGELRARGRNVLDLRYPLQPTRSDIDALINQVTDAKRMVIGTMETRRHPEQADLVRALYQQHPNLIVAALRTPYDVLEFPEVRSYLCTYGIRPPSIQALARVLCGEQSATGQLPCQIPNVAVHNR